MEERKWSAPPNNRVNLFNAKTSKMNSVKLVRRNQPGDSCSFTRCRTFDCDRTIHFFFFFLVPFSAPVFTPWAVGYSLPACHFTVPFSTRVSRHGSEGKGLTVRVWLVDANHACGGLSSSHDGGVFGFMFFPAKNYREIDLVVRTYIMAKMYWLLSK